ncbi:MAG: SDR family oxidoreductase [Nitrospirae bacterium]|nr:SDR family oxidoreductase [Nitrospirota bacterium]
MAGIFRDGLLTGKTAFITGGGSGINLRIAERFVDQGAKVGITGRKQERLDQAVAALKARGGEAMGVASDVRDYAALETAVRRTRESFGPIDIVICGAAGNFPSPAVGISANGFKAVVDIDLLGTFSTCRAAYEHLRKPGASIVSISATQAYIPTPLQAHVCAAKAGIDILTKTLALEWGAAGVRVNAISPGPVDDTEGMRRLTPSPEAKDKFCSTIPMRRYATKDEIADLALFLCSEAAGYITGAIYVCDGGQSLVGSGAFMGQLGM